ncbi:hypothetical protein QBC33DRAFT_141131 [Phialemonium atrogriseum]|uniref:Major facilitator superfamily (MFS) profile domain-containing protein n=1 Tax=Phialemonium atrogriseum TaxID=1093897 RepID=A0AAJ0C0H6_9PEZI|nr:uncharacterized protein QBC33DRAFT_141131 [Phialemonium atrogriseum]KAK1765426.1 hypothetical protein QBC33DRAFT_141131 [Phialemonium atrogriseum]
MSHSPAVASAGERTPLLSGDTQILPPRSSRERHSSDDNGNPVQEHTALPTGEDPSPKAKWTYAIYVVYFLVALSTSFAVSAMNKVEEMALLSRQHSRGFSALGREPPREIPGAVQDELTLLRGWQGILDSIVGGAAAIFLAALRSKMLPLSVAGLFGFVSGTKKILMLALAGILIGRVFNSLFFFFSDSHTYSLRLSWLSAASNLIGGGVPGFYAMIWTYLRDVGRTEDTLDGFLCISILGVLPDLAAGVAASFLIDEHPWIVIILSCVCLSLALLLAASCLEEDPKPQNAMAMGNAVGYPAGGPDSDGPSGVSFWDWISLKQYVGSRWLVFTFVITVPGFSFEDIKLQYMRSKFGQTWSGTIFQAACILLAQIVFLAMILAVNRWRQDRSPEATQRFDIYCACLCAALSSVGLAIFGLSEKTWLMLIGLGMLFCGLAFRMFLRHLLSLIVDANIRQGMFLLIDAIEHCGSFLGSLVVTKLYGLGLKWGGCWRGIPFLATSFLFLAAFVIVVAWHLHPPLQAGPVRG